MSLNTLPDEIIHDIVFWVSDGDLDLNSYQDNARCGNSARPAFSFLPNSTRFHNFSDLLSLSSTSRRFRESLGPGLFSFLSMVRWSEIDSVLDYPSRMDRLSDCKELRRLFFKELIQHNWQHCQYADSARASFRCFYDSSFYRNNLSINNFVEHLESCNEALQSSEVASGLFPNLRHLKVLDHAMPPGRQVRVPQLESLAINFASILNCDGLLDLVPGLRRLDVICDVNDLQPNHTMQTVVLRFAATGIKLEHFNFFVNDSDVLRYKDFLQLFDFLLSQNCILLMSLRRTRRHSTGSQWDVIEGANGPAFIASLQGCRTLRRFTVDFSFINGLVFPTDYVCSPPPQLPGDEEVSFTLVDSSLSVPKLLFRPREIVGNLVQGIGANHIMLAYGEVIDQAHLHAIGLMSNLLLYLQSATGTKSAYTRVRRVSLEKMWSMADDTLVRSHDEKLMDSWELHGRDKHADGRLWRAIVEAHRHQTFLFNSPRYRKTEHFTVLTEAGDGGDESSVPIMLPQINGKPLPNWFHSVESSLRDLEHYCFRDKALSSIWD